METTATIEKEIVDYCNEKNALVESGALKVLCGQKDFKKLVDEILQENQFIVSETSIKEKLLKKSAKLGEITQAIVKDKSFKASASEIESRFRILEELDVTNQPRSSGKIDAFLETFREKFGFLSTQLKKRTNLEIKPISRLAQTSKNNQISVCGMVSKKWVSKNGHAVVEIEDLENKCLCLFLQNDRQLFEQSKNIIPDDVIAVKGKKLSDEMVIGSEIHWPELPIKPVKTGEHDLNIVAISDIHVGSRFFLEKEFSRFINWINGNAKPEKEKEEAGKAKYMVICGDNVDGIGVYPDQFEDLAVKDIFEQYDAFCQLISQIPEHIEVFVIPGQHDAVRRADPQPAIPKEFVKGAAGLKNVHFVGSPSWIEIEGMKALMYHGASLHDVYSAVPGFDHSKPQEVMATLLKRRDLMASYGVQQPYAPEKNNLMLVREEPDFYFGGDMHHNGYLQYRACTVINAGTFQARTSFQTRQGFIPTPAIAVQVNLKNRKISEKHFGALA